MSMKKLVQKVRLSAMTCREAFLRCHPTTDAVIMMHGKSIVPLHRCNSRLDRRLFALAPCSVGGKIGPHVERHGVNR